MTLISLTLVVAVVGAALWLARRVKQSMLQPAKIQAAIHAHYQELLVARQLDPLRKFEVDFVFSASTAELARGLQEKLEVAGWRVSAQRDAEEHIVEAARELPSNEINFQEARELLVREAESTGCLYLGPGPRGLALVGINLPQ